MPEVIDFLKYRNEKKLDKVDEDPYSEDDFIIDTAINASYDIIEYLYDEGYDVTANVESIYDIITIIEAVKCLMKTTQDEEYPLHVVAKEMFTIENPEKTLKDFLEGG